MLTVDQGPVDGEQGGFRGLNVSFLLSFFVPFDTFPIFAGFSRFVRGFSGDLPDLSFCSFAAYEQHLRGTVPKGSATQSGPFPKKSGKPPGLETPWFTFSQVELLFSESVEVLLRHTFPL